MIAIAFVLAAGCGAATRHAVNLRGLGWLGTALVNVIGSLLIGLVIGLEPDDSLLTVIGVGFLGSLTTFSTFALEAAEARRTVRLAMVGLSLSAGIAAAALGHAIA